MYDIAILIVLVLLLLFIVYKRQNSEGFQVVLSYPDSDEAESTLRKLNDMFINFLEYLKVKFKINVAGRDESMIERPDYVNWPKIREIVTRLLHRYNPEVIIENDPKYATPSSSSWTEGKGKRMYLCIRDTETKKILPTSLLVMVQLHEMAHCANKTWGHDQDFWETFKFLLHEIKLAGLYQPVNYDKYPTMYCGMTISYQPLYDKSLKNIWEVMD